MFRIIIDFSVCADRRDLAAIAHPGKDNGRCAAQTGFVFSNFGRDLRCAGGSIFIRNSNKLLQCLIINILGIGPHIRLLAEIVCHRADQSLPGLRGLCGSVLDEAEEGNLRCLLRQRMVARLVAALKFTCNAVDLIYASILQTFKRVAAGEQRLRNRLSGGIIHAFRRNDDALRRRCCEVEGAIRITGQRHWSG